MIPPRLSVKSYTMTYVPPLAPEPVHYSLGEWIAENEKFFLPPVCIKMMHNTHLKVPQIQLEKFASL